MKRSNNGTRARRAEADAREKRIRGACTLECLLNYKWVVWLCLCARVWMRLMRWFVPVRSGIKRVAVENSSRMHARAATTTGMRHTRRARHLIWIVKLIKWRAAAFAQVSEELFLCLGACNSTSLMSRFWISQRYQVYAFLYPSCANCAKQQLEMSASKHLVFKKLPTD